jgi:RHS repeat-associated protein
MLDEGEGVSLLFDEPVVPAAGMELGSSITVTRAGAPVEGSTTRVSPWQLAWRPSQAGQSQWLLGGEYRVSIAGLVELGPEQKPVSTNLVPVTFTHLASGSEKHIVASVPPETPPRASSAFGNTTLFQGRLWVPELGLYYYRARWYDPMLVNFIERDPAAYADSPNLMQAFRYDPVNRRDPLGLWIFDFSRVPGNAATYQLFLQAIAHAARTLLLDPLTRRYLRKRFGDAAANEAYLRNIASLGTPPRVIYRDAAFSKPGLESAHGFFDADRSVIFVKERWLRLADDAATPCGRKFAGQGSLADHEFCKFWTWVHATLLVHETIHFIDEDTDKKPAFDAAFDPATGVGFFDTGTKWEYLLFGTTDLPDETSGSQLQDTFHIWLNILLDRKERSLFAPWYERRWQQVLDWLSIEEKKAKGTPRKGGER